MDIRALDLNLLPVFDALLRHRSVSLAARELDMSQPAMSHALKRLRALLGDPLFVRTGRGVMPTARADSLGRPVRDILERVRDELLAGGGFDPAETRRSFTFCLSDVGSYVLWPGIVRAMGGLAPHARLRLRTLEPERIAAALESGEVDLAIGAYPQLPGTLFQRRLFERKYVCLMRAGHPLSTRKPGLRQFAAAYHVKVNAPSRMQELVDTQLAEHGLGRNIALELPSYLMLPPLLEAGDYVAVVPGQLADAFSGRGRIAQAALPLALPGITIRQYWHRRFHDDPGNAWLRHVVAGLYGESQGNVTATTDHQK